MDTSQKDQKAINLMNCRVQQQKKEETQPQIFLNNHSQIANLPRKIHVPEHLLPANKAIQMSEIKSLADMVKVTVQIKVVNVEHPTEIRTQLGKELPKWDCLVAVHQHVGVLMRNIPSSIVHSCLHGRFVMNTCGFASL